MVFNSLGQTQTHAYFKSNFKEPDNFCKTTWLIFAGPVTFTYNLYNVCNRSPSGGGAHRGQRTREHVRNSVNGKIQTWQGAIRMKNNLFEYCFSTFLTRNTAAIQSTTDLQHLILYSIYDFPV